MTEPDFHLVAAALRRDTADVAAYAQVLTATLADALPPGWVTVERTRGLGDRIRGREGTVNGLTVRLGDFLLTLSAPHGRPVGQIQHLVRGVVLSREEVGLDAWLDTLARELIAHAADNARIAANLRRLIG